jgi:hypothetical protein
LLISSTPVHSRPMFVNSRTVIVSPLARPRCHGRPPDPEDDHVTRTVFTRLHIDALP